jgi:hypothetical protein
MSYSRVFSPYRHEFPTDSLPSPHRISLRNRIFMRVETCGESRVLLFRTFDESDDFRCPSLASVRR